MSCAECIAISDYGIHGLFGAFADNAMDGAMEQCNMPFSPFASIEPTVHFSVPNFNALLFLGMVAASTAAVWLPGSMWAGALLPQLMLLPATATLVLVMLGCYMVSPDATVMDETATKPLRQSTAIFSYRLVRTVCIALLLVQLVAAVWYLLMLAGWLIPAAALGHGVAIAVINTIGELKHGGMLI